MRQAVNAIWSFKFWKTVGGGLKTEQEVNDDSSNEEHDTPSEGPSKVEVEAVEAAADSDTNRGM